MSQLELPGTRNPVADFWDETIDESHPAVQAYERAARARETAQRAARQAARAKGKRK